MTTSFADFDGFHLDRELGVLAGQIGGAVIFGKLHRDVTFIARFRTDQLIFEARE